MPIQVVVPIQVLLAWLDNMSIKMKWLDPLPAIGDLDSMKKLKENSAYLTADVLKQHGAKHIPAMKFMVEIKKMVCNMWRSVIFFISQFFSNM